MRSPESILHEADYWKAVLTDVEAINEEILAAAASVAPISVELLALVLGEPAVEVADRIGVKTTLTLDAIQRAQEPLKRMLELVNGRVTAMERERDAA